jgi:EAL domain-containing protein (putative c-di-GMP-specific phosphodiesterase class I)
MDDFGTGYSSLSYFRSFRFDRIKIDRSFIRNLASDDSALAIIRAVAGLSASLGIATTAEGVETQAQLEQLRAEGYEDVQGFLFSPPRPASEIGEFLASARYSEAAA